MKAKSDIQTPPDTDISALRKTVPIKDIYGTLREMILNFELYPGSRVTETELAEMFMVSRTPVREALLRLEHEGMLTIRSKQGCFIKQIDIDELTDYYRVRSALEIAAVEDACHFMPKLEIERMLEIWDPAKQPAEIGVNEMEEKDESFHISLALGSGNETLVKYLRDVNDHIRIIRRVDFHDADRVKRTYQEHHAILKSVLEREVPKARTLMRRHIQRSQDFAKTLTLTQLARKKSLANRFGK